MFVPGRISQESGVCKDPFFVSNAQIHCFYRSRNGLEVQRVEFLKH